MTAGPLSPLVIAGKVDLIRQMLARIAALPLATVQDFTADPDRPAAGESYLRRAIEALLDLGRHLLAKGFGVAAAEYKEIPRKLGEHGVLDTESVATMTAVAGYRNRLVHFYDEITPQELYRILTEHRSDIERLLEELVHWTEEQGDFGEASD